MVWNHSTCGSQISGLLYLFDCMYCFMYGSLKSNILYVYTSAFDDHPLLAVMWDLCNGHSRWFWMKSISDPDQHPMVWPLPYTLGYFMHCKQSSTVVLYFSFTGLLSHLKVIPWHLYIWKVPTYKVSTVRLKLVCFLNTLGQLTELGPQQSLFTINVTTQD